MADTVFRTVFTTPDGRSGVVPDAPLPDFQDTLLTGPGSWRAQLPRPWLAAGFPGDARGTDDLVLGVSAAVPGLSASHQIAAASLDATAAGTVWRVYALSDATVSLPGGTVWGDWTWGQSTWNDPPQGSGQIVYQGQIEELTPTQDGTTEHVEVLLLPAYAALADTSTTEPLTFTDSDPVLVAKFFFDQGYVPGVAWDPRNALSGQTLTQTFQIQPVRQILDFCTQICGPNWTNHCDERGRFRLWLPDTSQADHIVEVGREVVAAAYTLTRTPQKNRVIVTYKGGGTAIATAGDWTQGATRDAVYNLPDVTDAATAQAIAQSILGTLNTLSVRARLTCVVQAGQLWLASVQLPGGGVFQPAPAPVISAQQRGCPSFSIRPGDTLQLWLDGGDERRFVWGDATWGQTRWTGGQMGLVQQPLVVQAVTYHGADTLDIDLGAARPNLVASHRSISQQAERALASLTSS